MDGPLIFLVVFLLILVVLQVIIYGYGSEMILSNAKLNTDFSIILGSILGPVWLIISLIRANHFNLENIILIVARFIGLSIGIAILFELLGGNNSYDAVISGRMGAWAFFPFVVWFFVIPFSLIGEKLFDINLEKKISEGQITEGPKKNNSKHNSDLRSSDKLSELGDKLEDGPIYKLFEGKWFEDVLDFLFSDDEEIEEETERVLKIKNKKPKPVSKKRFKVGYVAKEVYKVGKFGSNTYKLINSKGVKVGSLGTSRGLRFSAYNNGMAVQAYVDKNGRKYYRKVDINVYNKALKNAIPIKSSSTGERIGKRIGKYVYGSSNINKVKEERGKNESSNDSKNNAIEELKKLKELLDLKLITQDEFDKKSKELKNIILDN